ncbi:hypothetical protein ABEB36_013546 [Hypothenemus hampei]|uniref:Uncharacterized protein n=1 Tax=Hypothenemus hampei TaxID=57062 RepID=A0ABD1E4K5_HYPHA
MKKSYISAVLVFVLFGLSGTKIVEIKCPEFCECDIFHNLKRAMCKSKKLVSIELNLPKEVEILDASFNQINHLGDKIFLELGLNSLKLLNLSHNMVRQIHFNGFQGLEKLKSFDLSFNVIDYFTKSWFDSLQSLEEFYLRGNKLRSINEEPLIEIKTLKILDISNCGITSLKPDTFKGLPNLEVLDISENFLRTLRVDLLKNLPKLSSFQTNGLDFDCRDSNVIMLKIYVKTSKISYNDPCISNMAPSVTINQNVQKFEKMIMADDNSNKEINQPTTSKRNSWLIDVHTEEHAANIPLCENVTIPNQSVVDSGILMDIIMLSPYTVLFTVFIYGVFIGLILACVISVCSKKRNDPKPKIDIGMPSSRTFQSTIQQSRSVPNLYPKRHRKTFSRSNSVLYRTLQRAPINVHRELEEQNSDEETLVLSEFQLANSTPVPSKKMTN